MYRLLIIVPMLAIVCFAQAEDPKNAAPKVDEEKTMAETEAGGDALHPHVKLETTLGDIILELNGEKAPISTINFVQYCEDKFYDATIFHRVISNFMIQGGGHTDEMELKKDGIRSPIKNEWQNGLHNDRGTISMARTQATDSATCQFFINVVNNNSKLDSPGGGPGYAVFGKVVEGMDVVDAIRNTKLTTHPKIFGGRAKVVPAESVVVKTARVVGSADFDALKKQIAIAEGAANKTKEEADAKIAAVNEAVVKKIEEAQAKATETESGLKYLDTVVGDGPDPKKTDTILVHYTGWLLNGTKFDSSHDRGDPMTVNLKNPGLIPGFSEGLMGIKVGGKRMLIIPAKLGYGGRATGKIPANSTLVFEVEVTGIKG